MLNKRNWWNVAAVATLALVALFAVAPASAQEQVGAIVGTVSDASGAVLPGATVEAVSAGGTRLSGTTNESGAYRFPRVPPGMYVVVGKLDGFNPAEVQDVKVSLGDTVTANITLEVGAVSETISVVGEAGQVDVKSSATAASITSEQIESLPKGRDFTGIATQAAGASQEGFLGGISIDGASGSENRFVIDGVDTTHPQDGTSGQNMVTDFVEEVQVKSAGYAAEYGGSVGGVISAVTVFFAYRLELLQSLNAWLTGSFAGILRGRYELLWIAAILTVFAFIAADRFTVAGMGKDFTTNLGMNYNRVLSLGLIIVSLVTAVVVVTAGMIPFLGLMVPNIVRGRLGDNTRRAVPWVALGGAAFVLVCDMIGRMVNFPYEIPIGVVSGIAGSLLFLYLLLRKNARAG